MKMWLKIILSLLTGVLVCFSFPTVFLGWHAPDLGIVAWVALVPLLVVVRKSSPRSAFLFTFLSAAVWYSGSLYWVYRAMNTYGQLPPATSLAVLLLLIIIVAAYVALAPMLARLIETRWRGQFIVLLPVFWAALELCRNYFPCNGFPWGNIAFSQWRLLPVIQIADIAGVYGLSFLIVWTNVFVAEAVADLCGDKMRFLASKGAMTIFLIALTLGYGVYRMWDVSALVSRAESIRVALLQGNIDQADKWVNEKAVQNLNIYRAEVSGLKDAFVDLIVWPESAFPWTVDVDETGIDPQVLGISADDIGPLPYTLLGAISEYDDENYYNSALLMDAGGHIEGRYHKAHLVPFGEYVPYRKLLFFAKKLTAPIGTFIAGRSSAPLRAGPANLGVLICYEDIFPEIARREVRGGANLLVNLTNDAWYGVSSAPYQHLAISVFRAVEGRRFLLRATNTGVSAVISPLGRVVVESDLFQESTIVAPVGLISDTTVYTRAGDWFAWGCLIYAVMGIVAVISRRLR